MSICPHVGVQRSDIGELSVQSTRLGFGLGGILNSRDGSGQLTWFPFASPLLVFRDASVSGFEETGWHGCFSGGVRAAGGRLFGGLEFERVFTNSGEDRALASVGVTF